MQKKILIVEDDRELNRLYYTILKDAGFVVESIAKGDDALMVIKRFRPDLILLDIFLPRISGFEIVDQLRQNVDLAKIPVIVLTNVYIDRQNLLKRGIMHCLIKAEVTPDQVIAKIQEVLKK